MIIDKVNKDEFKQLVAYSAPNCASLFMPIHPNTPEGQTKDRIHLKNLVREAKVALSEGVPKLDEAEITALLSPTTNLLEDVLFGKNEARGLALFLAKDFSRVYYTAHEFDTEVVVGGRFYVRPLWSLLTADDTFYILALSQNDVRFLMATRYDVEEVVLNDVPTSMAEVVSQDKGKKEVQFHTGTSSRAAGRTAVYHGHDTQGEQEASLLRYFREIDAGLKPYLAQSTAPLVLAGVDYLSPIYQQANTYAHLYEEGIAGNPEMLSAAELHERAVPLLQPYFLRGKQTALETYQQLAHTPQVLTELKEVLEAAYHGRVDTLLIAKDEQAWGTFNPQTGLLERMPTLQANGYELFDLAASHTFLKGGKTYTLTTDEMPSDKAIAAILRY